MAVSNISKPEPANVARRPDAPVIGPPPPLDAECGAVLELVRDDLPLAITPELIPVLRSTSAAQDSTDEFIIGDGEYTVVEQEVPGPAGAPNVLLTICLPTGLTGPVAALYNIHGGGMIAGNRRTALGIPLDLVREQRLAVISVEYRLAPEHPDPAPIEDCYAGLVWTAEHAHELGIDPAKIIVFGVSGGGGLAASLVLLARDRGGPGVYAQMLLCPMIDDRNDTVSAIQMAGVGVWDWTANQTGWSSLLGDRQGGPDVSPYAAAARATDLSNLPPTFVDVGSAETFRDEAVDYATRIWQAGGRAELHVWPGGFHGYDVFAPAAAISRGTTASRIEWLRRSLAE